MSLALAHSSVTQANRYWSLGEKYTGHNGSFLTYLNELIKEVEFQMNAKKEGSRSYEIRKRTFTYLSLIQKKTNHLLVKKYETMMKLDFVEV